MDAIIVILMAICAFLASYGLGQVLYAPSYTRTADKVVWCSVHSLLLITFGGGFAIIGYGLAQTVPSLFALAAFLGLIAFVLALRLTQRTSRF